MKRFGSGFTTPSYDFRRARPWNRTPPARARSRRLPGRSTAALGSRRGDRCLPEDRLPATVALEAQGLLEDTADGYRTTPRGTALSALTETYFGGIDAIERLQPLFESVSHPELVEHAYLLTDATVPVVDPENPYLVAERSVERFEAASDVRGVVASASPRGLLESALPVLDTKGESSGSSPRAHSQHTIPSAAIRSGPASTQTTFRSASSRTTTSPLGSPSIETTSPSPDTTPRAASRQCSLRPTHRPHIGGSKRLSRRCRRQPRRSIRGSMRRSKTVCWRRFYRAIVHHHGQLWVNSSN